MLALPAFAADVNPVTILKQPVDRFASPSKSFSLSVIVSGDVSSYQWQYRYIDSDVWHDCYPNSINGRSSSLSYSIQQDRFFRCVITSLDGSVIYTRDILVEIEPTNLFNFIISSLRYVTSYVGLIINSLVFNNGALYPLLPILAIGIAVTAVLLIIKIFKSFSWGL